MNDLQVIMEMIRDAEATAFWWRVAGCVGWVLIVGWLLTTLHVVTDLASKQAAAKDTE